MLRFLLIVVFLFIPITSSSAESGAGVGKSIYASGEVHVIRGAERLSLKEGEVLFSADSIVTGSSGRVSLHMNDGSTVHIGRLSRINLSRYDITKSSLLSGAFKMLWGKVRFVVAKLSTGSDFKVSTKTAVLGVRGTEFLVVVPMPEGIVDPLTNELPVDLAGLITTVFGIEGLVEGVSTSGQRVLIGPGVKVEFTSDGKIKFSSLDKPLIPTIKPGQGTAPEIPTIPKPSDIVLPPQIRGQFLQ